MKGMTYKQSLQLLNITTLEKRRQRGDLIEVNKILTGKEDMDPTRLFQFALQNLSESEYHKNLIIMRTICTMAR